MAGTVINNIPSTPPIDWTGLGRYPLLSPNAAVHVSPIQLGAESIGDKWAIGMGSIDKELGAYFNNGGNFIDTANMYQDGSSEMFIGEWVEARGIRDQLFIGTKYSFHVDGHDGGDSAVPQKILNVGNGVESLRISVEKSLKRLRTTYLDLIYFHWWDWDTSIEEVMLSLHTLVFKEKSCAWNVMERSNAKSSLWLFQKAWLLAPWNILASGEIRTDEEEEKRRQTGEKGRTILNSDWERSEKEETVSKALEKVAAEIGAKHITSVAIAYLMQKTPYVFPIIGGRKVEHLLANLEALEIFLK
ncbi:Aldo/keto reductase [Phlegmacium glaucopus]|nr:Aldo/keto reductase [Phlegmacium glaucopus]